MNSQDFYNWCRLEYLIRRASEFLRTLLKKQWTAQSNKDWKDHLSGKDLFDKIQSKPKKNVYSKPQQSLLKRGDIKNWDITLLKNVFLDSDICGDDVRKNAEELAKKRNELAHNASKTVSDADFEVLWKDISKILVNLGDSQNELDELKGSIQLQNKFNEWSENIQKASELKTEGNNYFKEKKFSEAITSYTDAIVLPDIPDHDLALIYANRSASYLEKYLNKKDKFESYGIIESALKDAKKSKDLNPEWYKGHFRLGKVYLEINKLDKALKAFERALTLDPNNEELKTLLDAARKTQAEQRRSDYLDYEEQTEQEMNPEEVEKIRKAVEKHNPVLKDVHQGHDARDRQDFEEAARCYGKAVNKGNAEAMYNLARLHQKGLKVKKDVVLALSLLERAADQPPFDPVLKTPMVGVAEAEYSIGSHHYRKGDILEAIRWFERAVEHGSGRSAYNLGLMYFKGEGVEQNLEKAEQYFLIAANRNDRNAPDNLVVLYKEQKIPEKALKWNKIAMEKSSKAAVAQQEELEAMVADLQKTLEKLKIVEWEKENNLSSEDLTIRERIQRKIAFGKNPHQGSNLDENPEKIEVDKENSGEEGLKYDLNELKKYCDKSETAQRIFKARTNFMSSLELLEKISNENVSTDNEEHRKFVIDLAESYRNWHEASNFPRNLISQAKKIINKMMDQIHTFKKEKKLSKDLIGLDQDAIICFAVLNSDSPKTVIDFLSDSIHKYPQNKEFLVHRGNAYRSEQKYEHALRDYNRLLEMEPGNYQFLYSRAVCFRHLGHLNAVKAYEEYLAKAPIDDPRRPETYYEMGICTYASVRHSKGPQSKEHVEKISRIVREYYDLGLKMEKEQLPCFLPYESSNKKMLEFSINPESLPAERKEPASIQEKPKLQDLFRKQLIIDNRKSIKEWKEEKRTNFDLDFKLPSEKKRPSLLIGLKPIFINEIDFTKEHAFNGFVLEVTIIDLPLRVGKWTVLVVEDKKGSVQSVALWNFGENIKGIKDLGIGSTLSIINPSIKIMLDKRFLIRVDEPSSAFFGDKINNMCACCGDLSANLRCGECKTALYCSEGCKIKDREEFQHQLICAKK